LRSLGAAEFDGGSIHNIALNAVFWAAQAGTAVTMPLVLAAARTEFHEADFRYSPTVNSNASPYT